MRHLLNLFDLAREEILALFDETSRLKEAHRKGDRKLSLNGKVLGLVFEKPSLRTRVSFQAAMAQLGGSGIYLSGSEAGLGTRETIPDFARVISQYVDGVVLRTFAHGTVEEFAQHSTCPVINGLSDYYHPCQALADLFTMREVFGSFEGRTLVFVGDGNNVARSLAVCCAHLGVRFVLAPPRGYGFDEPFVKRFQQRFPAENLGHDNVPTRAVERADIIYTDVWTSMGQESEQQRRRKAFADYQVNSELLANAPAHAKVMHCLPAHRGEEITTEVMDSDRCIAFQQAGNRLHLQKALLLWLLSK